MSSSDQPTLFGLPVVEVEGLKTQPKHQRFVAFVDGAFGGRRVILDGEPDEMIRRAAEADPKLARELKRRGWIP